MLYLAVSLLIPKAQQQLLLGAPRGHCLNVRNVLPEENNILASKWSSCKRYVQGGRSTGEQEAAAWPASMHRK
jgi:hypothetical protein